MILAAWKVNSDTCFSYYCINLLKHPWTSTTCLNGSINLIILCYWEPFPAPDSVRFQCWLSLIPCKWEIKKKIFKNLFCIELCASKVKCFLHDSLLQEMFHANTNVKNPHMLSSTGASVWSCSSVFSVSGSRKVKAPPTKGREPYMTIGIEWWYTFNKPIRGARIPATRAHMEFSPTPFCLDNWV